MPPNIINSEYTAMSPMESVLSPTMLHATPTQASKTASTDEKADQESLHPLAQKKMTKANMP